MSKRTAKQARAGTFLHSFFLSHPEEYSWTQLLPYVLLIRGIETFHFTKSESPPSIAGLGSDRRPEAGLYEAMKNY
jgi:hypothetical protein